MIKIQNASEVEDAFFEGKNFEFADKTVSEILETVRTQKDSALKEFCLKFDKICPASFEIPIEEAKQEAENLQKENPALYEALCYSRDLALRFAKKQRECFTDFEVELEPGLFTGQKNIPVKRAGVYVPAGRFPLVSTVIMTVIPALASGVQEIILCTPPKIHPNDSAENTRAFADKKILAASYICGVSRIFACGGAQSIAAMAFGTESIPKVDVIVGPGNKFVAEAKRLVYGTVGIDMVAGPTEVFIIADSSANPEWVAADLLAQAEHDVVASPILATPDKSLAQKVSEEIQKQLQVLPTRPIAEQSILNCGRIIITESLEQAAEFANRKAPEHLELAISDSELCEKIASLVHNYGSLFIGHSSAEVFGDYAAGLNHTLPTLGSARFTGGLSVRVFLKTVTTLRTKQAELGVQKSAKMAGILGDAEGLCAHAKSARLRLNQEVNNENL